MQSVYTLTGRVAELNTQAKELQGQIDLLEEQLEQMYEENGGEVTDLTESAELKKVDLETFKAQLERLSLDIIDEIIDNSDEYAEWALNEESNRKQAEAELDALKKSCNAAIKKAQARVNRYARWEDWAKQQFADAMRLADTQKIGGAKTDKKHSVFFKSTPSIEANEDALKAPYQDEIESITATLPGYLKVKVEVAKSGFKGVADDALPEGATRVYNQSIQIR